MIEYAIDHWNEGGIVTPCWHWCPDGKYDNGKNTWGTFYTENTTFDLKKDMSGQDEYGYQMLFKDIDAIAVQLKIRSNAGFRSSGVLCMRPAAAGSGGVLSVRMRIWNCISSSMIA